MVKKTKSGLYYSKLRPFETLWADEYPFESHYYEVRPNLAIHYVDEGPLQYQRRVDHKQHHPPSPKGTIVMFHGNPTWSFYYRNLIKHFSKDYRCIAFDHIGCGLSSKPTAKQYTFRLEDRINDAEQLLDDLNISEATFVMHDWGGAIGMGVACRNPERIQSLVVFNTAAFRSDTIPVSINMCKIPILGELMVLGFNGFARVAQWRAVSSTDLLPRNIRQAYLAPYDTPLHRLATLKFVHDIPMSSDHPSYSTLGEVEAGLQLFESTRMLICWGGGDFCFDKRFYAEWQRRFPLAECHLFEDAGHYVLEEKAPQIITYMEEFLSHNNTVSS